MTRWTPRTPQWILWLLIIIGIILIARIARAQTTPVLHVGDPIFWEIDAPDLATAQTVDVYHLLGNGVQIAPSLPGVTCSVAVPPSTFTCKAPLPASTPLGTVTLTLSALRPNHVESAISNALLVSIEQPATEQPRNLRGTPQ